MEFAGVQGFEPRFPGPKPGVLPIRRHPKCLLRRKDSNLDLQGQGLLSCQLDDAAIGTRKQEVHRKSPGNFGPGLDCQLLSRVNS